MESTQHSEPRDRELLERLCMYRRLYARRSRYDCEPILTVHAAIAYGEALLRHARTRDVWMRCTP